MAGNDQELELNEIAPGFWGTEQDKHILEKRQRSLKRRRWLLEKGYHLFSFVYFMSFGLFVLPSMEKLPQPFIIRLILIMAAMTAPIVPAASLTKYLIKKFATE
jgi:hypothetical protein